MKSAVKEFKNNEILSDDQLEKEAIQKASNNLLKY